MQVLANYDPGTKFDPLPSFVVHCWNSLLPNCLCFVYICFFSNNSRGEWAKKDIL